MGTIIAMARIVSARGQSSPLGVTLIAIGLLLVPAALIVLQNDTGTALVFIGIIPIVLFWTGTPLWLVILLVSPAVAGYLSIWYMPAAIAFSLALALALYLWYRNVHLAAAGGLISVPRSQPCILPWPRCCSRTRWHALMLLPTRKHRNFAAA